MRKNTDYPDVERKDGKRDVSPISRIENILEKRTLAATKLLCWNGRARFRRSNTEIYPRTRETQFLLWLKPEVSLRGIL